MRRQHRPTPDEQIEEKIRAAGSIGNLERMAGIDPSPDGRYAFWTTYNHLAGAQSLDAGVAELKRLIRARAKLGAWK